MFKFSTLKFGEIAAVALYWIRAAGLGFVLYQILAALSAAGVRMIDPYVHLEQEVFQWSNYLLVFIEHALPAFISAWMLCYYVPASKATAARVFTVLVVIFLCCFGPLARFIRSDDLWSNFIEQNPDILGIIFGTACTMLVFPKMTDEERRRFYPTEREEIDRLDPETPEEMRGN